MQTADWKTLAVKFGPGWAIAIFLIGWLVMTLGASLSAIRTDLTSHISDHRVETQRSNYWLAALCRHTAKNTEEREDCNYQEPAR